MSIIIILSIIVVIIFVSVIVAAIVLKTRVAKADDVDIIRHPIFPPATKVIVIVTVSLITLAVISFEYFGWNTRSSDVTTVADNSTYSGDHRVELTTKEEQMLQQYCTDIHNSYGLSFDKAYVVDYPDTSSIINVVFVDAGYQGKIIHGADGSWTGKLERLIYNE